MRKREPGQSDARPLSPVCRIPLAMTPSDLPPSPGPTDPAVAGDGAEAREVDRWAERRRIAEQSRGERHWSLWGPYLSERQWGTVREDYSRDGEAWRFVTHDDARSRAYRWGEDGIAGLCDDHGLMCLSLALWNGRDHILKERLFGLTNAEGNHGEDVKEVYHYLDAVPSHAYLRQLYRYPQGAFPYEALIEENRRRGRGQPEYEIEETGIFDDGRFFDVTVEYAKEDAEDIHMRVTALNRGPEAADLHLVPQLWFRNTWAWRPDGEAWKPRLSLRPDGSIACEHPRLGSYQLCFEGAPAVLFCENETNRRRYGGPPDAPGPFKDGLHAAIVSGDATAVRDDAGTKVGLHYRLRLGPGESAALCLRLVAGARPCPVDRDGALLRRRIAEADAFYDALTEGIDDGRFAGDLPAGGGGADLVEAALPLRRADVAPGRPAPAGPAARAPRRAQPDMAQLR